VPTEDKDSARRRTEEEEDTRSKGRQEGIRCTFIKIPGNLGKTECLYVNISCFNFMFLEIAFPIWGLLVKLVVCY
jgi:hypothetical protein